MENCGEVERERERVRIAGGASSVLARHRCVRKQKKTIESKKRKKFFGDEVCAPKFACVGVQRKFVDEHRERGNRVAEFVELANKPRVTAG